MPADSQPVWQPREFAGAFQDLVMAMQALMQACRPPERPRTPEEYCCDSSHALENPADFMQTLSDLLRVVFEPNPPGSMLLNSNWDLLVGAVPHTAFGLVHLSSTSTPGQSPKEFLAEDILPRLAARGFAPASGHGAFVALCLPPGEPSGPALLAANRQFAAGFSVAQAVEAIRAEAHEEAGSTMPNAHVGVARDPMLAPGRMRVSVWCFTSSAASLQ